MIGSLGENVMVTAVAPPSSASASPLDGTVLVVHVAMGKTREAKEGPVRHHAGCDAACLPDEREPNAVVRW